MAANARVGSQLDYCNSLFRSLPALDLRKLQCVQNSLARIVTNTTKYSHITPVRKTLHWLPIEHRFIFNTALTHHAALMAANALVGSRLDYCNSLFRSLPALDLRKLQCVQNSLARIVTNTTKYSHITPVRKTLHWLPIEHRFIFNTALTHHAALMAANALVGSRLDYCNSLFRSLPALDLHKLQCVQNSLARIVTNTTKYSHITSVRKTLHRLPIEHRSIFKTTILVYKFLHRGYPK